MGYRFTKRDAEPFHIRLHDAGTVRVAAGCAGLYHLMPDTEREGGAIPAEHRGALVNAFRDQALILQQLADYLADGEDLGWHQ